MKTPLISKPIREILTGSGAVFSLIALALISLSVSPHPRVASRGLAAAFGPLANQPASVNVASILNTFQTPNSVLPMTSLFSQIQSQMQAGIPAGTPVWDGHGELPGAVGTAGFNPTFHLDTSGCNVVSMTMYSVYLPSMDVPTVWCGAVSQAQTKTTGISASIPDELTGNGSSGTIQPRAIQFTGNHPAL